ncbi:hypothetical protein PIROE2DRAFT_11486 [Piromyces sp. E2]|nr:hypothetical protein PIROE2DRAFT_11486 [Piromyces sp. E2]|eukprot:OUM62284.1 hypothetical protein PIROE2DRAFT_11486 [Piromyces sp. E2]
MRFNIVSVLISALLATSGIEASLTKGQKNTLLELHRKARDEVNSPNMKRIYWDDSLAKLAQKQADTCSFYRLNSGPVNIALASRGNVEDLFNVFYREKAAFDETNTRAKFEGPKSNSKKISHYSQIVWAENDKVGCGLSFCDEGKMLVCQYATGNVIGKEVYQQAKFSLTDEQKNTLLELHRKARAEVNATNMKEIKWDDELAEYAQIIDNNG